MTRRDVRRTARLPRNVAVGLDSGLPLVVVDRIAMDCEHATFVVMRAAHDLVLAADTYEVELVDVMVRVAGARVEVPRARTGPKHRPPPLLLLRRDATRASRLARKCRRWAG